MAAALLLPVLSLAGAAYGLVSAVGAWLVFRSVVVLERTVVPAPARWPKLSVVIPARDEAGEIEQAVRSRLQDGYPTLEVVLVDDRSIDGTGEIIDRLASADPRVRAVHLTELPEGWLGKLHALERGYREATGELILFSDADVHVWPGALSRAVAWMEHEQLDQLGVAPALWSSGALLDGVFAVFQRLLWLAVRPWAIANPGSSASFGVGAFSLVRRSALVRSPGFEHLRLEQIDDAGLGQMMKRAGARCGAANGRGLLGLHYYRSVGEMARGLEKFGARVPFLATCAAMLVVLVLELGPWVALGVGEGWTRLLGGAGAALTLLATVATARWSGQRAWPALAEPIGAVILVAMVLRAAALAAVRGGVSWRGTFHETAALREGSRYRVG